MMEKQRQLQRKLKGKFKLSSIHIIIIANDAKSSTSSPQPSPEVIALKSTIDRLTKQLKKIKREKNLAADLLDRRADDHEKEIKI